jgi:hypothetical protein
MSNLTHLAGEFWGVSVPKDAKDITPVKKFGSDTKIYYTNHNRNRKLLVTMSGEYSIIGVSDELTEEQYGEIVDSFGGLSDLWFKNYVKNNWTKTTALESFHSLLRSKGLERVVVIKKVII